MPATQKGVILAKCLNTFVPHCSIIAFRAKKNHLNDVNKCVLTFDTFISGNLTLKLIIVHPLSIEVHCRTKRADISCVFSWFTSKTLLRWHAGAETTYTDQRRDSVKARAVCAAAVSANQN